MVGWKRVKFGVEIHAWSFDPDACAGRVRDVDIHMDLCHGDSQSRPAINDGMFTK
jgi:hypothetical protein